MSGCAPLAAAVVGVETVGRCVLTSTASDTPTIRATVRCAARRRLLLAALLCISRCGGVRPWRFGVGHVHQDQLLQECMRNGSAIRRLLRSQLSAYHLKLLFHLVVCEVDEASLLAEDVLPYLAAPAAHRIATISAADQGCGRAGAQLLAASTHDGSLSRQAWEESKASCAAGVSCVSNVMEQKGSGSFR